MYIHVYICIMHAAIVPRGSDIRSGRSCFLPSDQKRCQAGIAGSDHLWRASDEQALDPELPEALNSGTYLKYNKDPYMIQGLLVN